jgi:hypothetical protein
MDDEELYVSDDVLEEANPAKYQKNSDTRKNWKYLHNGRLKNGSKE